MKTSYLFSLLLSLLFLCSCSTKKIQPIKEGRFVYIWAKSSFFAERQKEDLILRADSTFKFNTYAGKNCMGNWRYISADEILIKCFEPEHELDRISGYHPNPDIIKFKVINENKLKMPIEGNVKRDHVILKRVE